MKKIFAVLLAFLLIAALFTSCSGAKTSDMATDPAAYGLYNTESSTGDYDRDEGYYEDMAEAPADGESGMGVSTTSAQNANNSAASMTEKIIYTYYANIETTQFDTSVDNVSQLLKQYGAFIQSTSISGSSYYSNTRYRTAEYVIRVPVGSYTPLTESLDILGNVVSERSNGENITTQFIDTQARLDTYETEEERLLAMLEKADTVEDMITIESRLSDVRYQIESLTSQLRNWQNQVDYSTVTLEIREVEELSAQVPAQRTYWERMWDGLASTFEGIGDFFKQLFMFIVVALPVLVILGVIAVIVLVTLRASKKRKARKNSSNIDPKE